MIDKKDFARVLKALITSKHLTQKALANELNIPEYRMSRYCLGKQEPSMKDLMLISLRFSISIDNLLGKEKFLIMLIEEYENIQELLPFDCIHPSKVLKKLTEHKCIQCLIDSKNYIVNHIDFNEKRVFAISEDYEIDKIFMFKDYGKVWVN